MTITRSRAIKKQTRRVEPPRAETGHRVNHEIRISPVRVIGPDGEQVGVMPVEEARAEAERLDLDLVEVAPNVRPPVCRIMDYGKFRYEQSKKKSASSAAKVEIKEIRFRPNTDDNDLNTKLKSAEKFLKQGHKVKFVIRMRGRERAYMNRWVDQMNDLIKKLEVSHEGGIKVLEHPRSEGRQISAMVESAATT